MATKLSSIIRTTYKNAVGDITMNYSIQQNTGEGVKDVSASLRKGEELLGSIGKSTDSGLRLGFSASVTDEEAKQIVSTFLTDAAQITQELTPNEEEA